MTLTDLFTDLEVLSMIQQDDKLCVRDGRISIEKKSHPMTIALRRFFNNDNRRLTMMQINSIISQSLQACKDIRNDPEKLWATEQFCNHFSNVLAGLKNLKMTYSDDSAVVARLNVISAMLLEEISTLKNARASEPRPILFSH
jgi:nucleoid-associated protein YejK